MPWTTPPRVLGTRPVWLDSGDERAFPGTVRAAALLALLTAALLQCILAWSRRFHTDEWQHLHAAWCVAQGLLPYRDFFEHHTPALWYLLAPWMAWSRPELDPDRAVAFLRGVRLLFLVPTAVLIALTWRLARRTRGPSRRPGCPCASSRSPRCSCARRWMCVPMRLRRCWSCSSGSL